MEVKNRRKYLFRTYGCQMNEHDTEIMEGMLNELGYAPTTTEEDADFIIFNTCSVRENADNKVFGEIGRMKNLKRSNPNMLLALCGCMAQQQTVVDRILKSYPQVDMVFGTHNIHKLPELIEQAFLSKETIIDVWQTEGEIVENLPRARKDGLKAWVTIMYGCNNFCTYCIVPHTRGRERSRSFENIITEIKQLKDEGYKEVTLLGQNVNSYGNDLEDNVDFPTLLKEIDKIGINRIRFMTSHPKDFTDELMDVIKNSENICEQIHLPFQAGSDEVLKRMNRKHSREWYLDKINAIKNNIPNVALSTDIIVGFPGETDEQFEKTLDMVRQVEFDIAYTFIYSPRTGTPAANLEDNISLSDKKRRLQALIQTQNDISKKKNLEYVNKTVEVLVEGYSKTNTDKLTGRTRTNKVVNFFGEDTLIGQLVNIRIETAKTWSLEGVIDNDGK
ncbi:tRNA (N6-isopentenyl adenosine(37)-C2)-methylthiotransferase MiaB [Desulfuribacillus alkaliarsenatis]|uniref:tRNA-2-methylthio-N(6)-dimethylallyladenosine synthase n=1 Tax=Desulfuribacillus alkaliarsenatis TaxID=766136 RepID=A0A1E5FZL3_9FIRM|nr:tRNA (N6-isopentenyl adenosine(37)-C2)-methylthiotransferase MiaB [Desulfuribacillus alkaliarsenatis]OEF96016.1 tRNA (N6-isopentenyl adenosine(37)-C2)-methylthiotransferase MiaB [Desulfuribacillus alkaliarsenatis]